jgi:stearoyl-CoA desaturase (Delta-9 desaturase)
VAAGLALPVGLGVALTGSLAGGLTGLLWGGAVRISCCMTRPSASTRSATASDGGRSAPTDESRNLAWLAPLAFGEAWHNRPAAMPGTRDDDGMPSGRSGREREW